MKMCVSNKALKAYIGQDSVNYIVRAAGVGENRVIPAKMVNLFKSEDKPNRLMIDFIRDSKSVTINGRTASEWVLCRLPEGALTGYAEVHEGVYGEKVIDFYSIATKSRDRILKSFTPKEFGCWFGMNTLPYELRETNNLRLEEPEPLIDKSESNIERLRQENILRGRRWVSALLNICANSGMHLEYLKSGLHHCGRPGESYKMMLMLSINASKSGAIHRVEIGLVYYGDTNKYIWLYTDGQRKRMESLNDVYLEVKQLVS